MSDMMCSAANYLGIGKYFGCTQVPPKGATPAEPKGVSAKGVTRPTETLKDPVPCEKKSNEVVVKAANENDLMGQTYIQSGAFLLNIPGIEKGSGTRSVYVATNPERVKSIKLVGDGICHLPSVHADLDSVYNVAATKDRPGTMVHHHFVVPIDDPAFSAVSNSSNERGALPKTIKAHVEIEFVNGTIQRYLWTVPEPKTTPKNSD